MNRYKNNNLSLPNNDQYIPRVHRSRSRSPQLSPASTEFEEGLPVFQFNDDSNRQRLQDTTLNEISATLRQPAATSAAIPTITMSITQEQFASLQQMMEAQQKQIEEMKAAAEQQHNNLLESQRQLHESQTTVQQLSSAFQQLSTRPPQQVQQQQAARKKPDLPPFDAKNILIWIKRIESAYTRANVTLAKDKFAFLESTFPVKQNATIDKFMYGSNTEDDWADFLSYLKKEYGPTIRQKACKLMSEVPRHDMKPTEYLQQLVDDTADVEIDHIRREHLLKTIPPRIREIMGKDVENLTALEVAQMADDFFDRNGRPLEKTGHTVNNVVKSSSSSSSASAAAAATPHFTAAFSDEEDSDVNFVKRGGKQNFRGRSQSRNGRSNSKPRFNNSNQRFNNSNNNASASSSSSSNSSSSQQSASKTCMWHRRFGTKSTKCCTDCSLYQSFVSQQRKGSGNEQGGRRM